MILYVMGIMRSGGGGLGLCSSLRKRSVMLYVLVVASCSFLEMPLLPLMLFPIIPFIGREGLYANRISPLHISIL